jgi:hypothetical protein
LDAQLPGQNPSGKVWMSMYNIASVQSWFVGLITTNTGRFGMQASDEELANYVYVTSSVQGFTTLFGTASLSFLLPESGTL